ncbi:MAG: transcription-repair coupling factor [Chloroflexi bacterium]|nr:transcription-repair coupling factor [Chloroflexota bacterium]
MDLHRLTSAISDTTVYRDLVDAARQGDGGLAMPVLRAAQPYLAAALHQELRTALLVVVPSAEEARTFYEQLQVWHGDPSAVLLYPKPDALPYESLPADPSKEQERLRVLTRLAGAGGGPEPGISQPMVVCAAASLVRKTTPVSEFRAAVHTLEPGMTVNPIELLTRWTGMGYERVSLVETPGNMSQRGGIIDVYSPDSEMPARIEFLGNRIESIRLFDPLSQRSLKPASSLTLVAARESAGPAAATLVDHLAPESLVVLSHPEGIEAAVNELDAEARLLRRQMTEEGALPDSSPVPYLTYAELAASLAGLKHHLELPPWQGNDSRDRPPLFTSPRSYGGQLESFVQDARLLLEHGCSVIVVSQQAARLSELFQEKDIITPSLPGLDRVPEKGSLTLVHGSLSAGWIMGQEMVVITDAEIFGFVRQSRQTRPRPAQGKGIIPDLSPGDYAVHVDHGIGRFVGMKKISLDQAEREYLTLEYAAGDLLYVPTDQADRVSHYIGAAGGPPALSRLGTQEWDRVKRRVRDSAREMAQSLLKLYATREVVRGFSYSADSAWQQELEASFPYMETPDQMEAVRQVKEDMEKAKPMDRLVCGDVGYGKTEIAIRASFKAVSDGRQVAFLVPTTVLAQQHFTTFTQRLASFPMKVEMLSRFRGDREQRAIVEGLKDGSVDICIGTHRLLQKDVVFKNLGLVIVDEEQRFGVGHKERLKQLRQEVDVLTMTATPIPRTLHMALVGVRDMSTLETPPEERLPIKTYVAEYNEPLIREAIIRELERNGQVFFVHNRVETINHVAHRLRELVPEANTAVAHGQMDEEELEITMIDFAEGRVDVLLCTTIIESGLDMPNANTLIVNDADRLGLAQLYQLRGRVGRGSNRAYAYFLHGKGKRLTPAAEKRLQTIFESSELGAGFRIAMKDLEIRGAGNLLGSEQSGHIAAVGFGLYCQLLAEAVQELKARQEGGGEPGAKPMPAASVTVDLPLSAYIPEDYVTDPTTRVALYQRLARLTVTDEVEELRQELRDRFGALPLSVQNLLYLVRVKLSAARAGARSIAREDGRIVIRFAEGREPAADGAGTARRSAAVQACQVQLDTKRLGGRWQQALEETLAGLIRESEGRSPGAG